MALQLCTLEGIPFQWGNRWLSEDLEDENIHTNVQLREDDLIYDGADQATAEEEFNPTQGIECL